MARSKPIAKIPIQVRLTQDTHDALTRLATTHNLSTCAMIVAIVEERLNGGIDGCTVKADK